MDVSADGRIIVGRLRGPGGKLLACRWVDGQTPEALLAWDSLGNSWVNGIRRNGQFITGAMTLDGKQRAFLRTFTGELLDLGIPPGAYFSEGTAVSEDGKTMAAWPGPPAGLWKADIGWIRMQNPGWIGFTYLAGLTATGRFAVGELMTIHLGFYGLYWREDTGFAVLWGNSSRRRPDRPSRSGRAMGRLRRFH